MLKPHIEAIEKQNPAELQAALVELLKKNPTALFNPNLFLSLLSGEESAAPLKYREKQEALLDIILSEPEKLWSLAELCLMLGVLDGDPETKVILWQLESRQVIEFTSDWKVKAYPAATP